MYVPMHPVDVNGGELSSTGGRGVDQRKKSAHGAIDGEVEDSEEKGIQPWEVLVSLFLLLS